ncbi:acyl-CoA dehydrogenase [Pandoraea cepalis]|uniref:Acyl-CoA dehydrogenase n=1 Tax=Pandoraea cepalis TaxID=2508294 RepID=A0AAW7MHN5_9BURK|nr:acyl-CoA dehydrogenase family protein [Pandoraea cepalis]MDN4572275.1 acyl-CoA dehydrogenase [Pandoraea cepalis]MDN4576882.1 acyl-CoA dehydrogenase [Pandoraea cepalis]
MSRELASAPNQPSEISVRFGHAAAFAGQRADDLATAASLLDGEAAAELQRLIDRARELRPLLREEQAATEERGHYSSALHEIFWNEGFYRVLEPRRFGGLQLGVAAFYRVVAEVSRGCPSTGWCLCLGAGHSLQIASYFSEQAQQSVFGLHGQVVAASSGGGQKIELKRVEGGYRLSGIWRYCSGSPHSTHFMPVVPGFSEDPSRPPETWWMLVERAQYEVLDDWGQVMGMRGSGSNSIRIDGAFVPEHMIVRSPDNFAASGPSVGSRLHDDPVYAGAFRGFAEGEIAAVAVGLAMACVDELEHLLGAPLRGQPGKVRADHIDFQRAMGMALATADASGALSVRGGQLYEAMAKRSVAGIEPFSADRAMRVASLYFMSERMSWETVDQVLRAAGSSAMVRGHRLERYSRDALTIRSRTDQLEFDASAVGSVFLRSGK